MLPHGKQEIYVVYEAVGKIRHVSSCQLGSIYSLSFVPRGNLSELPGENALVQHEGWFEELPHMSDEEAMAYIGYIVEQD